jgi:hypothetical protein
MTFIKLLNLTFLGDPLPSGVGGLEGRPFPRKVLKDGGVVGAGAGIVQASTAGLANVERR